MILYNPQTKIDHEIILKRTTGEEPAQCPVCSDDRKKKSLKCFSFNHEKQVGRCSHCNCALVPKKEFEPKKEYVRPPVWANETKLSDNLVKWFEGRGIKQKTLEDFKIAEGKEFMPQEGKDMNCIKFPYFRNGELLNVKYRTGNKHFKLYKDAELVFFNLNAIKDTKRVIIVEGEMDCLIVSQNGYTDVVSVPNGAGLNKINLSFLDNCIEYFIDKEEILIGTDDDAPGRNLCEQLAERLGKERCYKIQWADKKDANDCFLAYGVQGIIDSINNKKEFPLEGVFTIDDFEDEINDIYDHGLPKGAKTMMGELNKLIKFHKGYFTTITGTPGAGKTKMLDQIILQLGVVNDWKVAYFSPESKPTSLHISNLCCALMGKKWWAKEEEKHLRITPDQLKLAKGYLRERVHFIEPEKDYTLDSILNTVKGLIMRKGIDCFVIDAWNTLEHKYSGNETQYINECLGKISAFCKLHTVHGFIVAHPTKIPKQKNSQEFEVPNLYSISGSANFYNRTDVGLCIYRNYTEECTYVYVQKVKFQPYWGSTGHCRFKYDTETGRYNEFFGGALDPSFDKTSWIHSGKQNAGQEQPKQEIGIIINKEDAPF